MYRLARGLLDFTPIPGGFGLPGLRCQGNLTTEKASEDW